MFFDVRDANARMSGEALTMDAIRALKGLDLGPDVAASTLGIGPDDVAELLSAGLRLEPDTGLGRRAFLLVRLYRAMGDVFGGLERVNQWLRTDLPELGGRPLDLIQGERFDAVVGYIERQCRDARAWVW